MYRFKLSWILAVVAVLIWSVVIFKLSAFAAVEQPVQFVWTAQTQPMSGTPAVIEMKPTMLAPKGMPPAPMRSLLTRVLGKSLGGLIPSAGIVYQVMDLEGRRQTVAYAIEQLMKNGQPVTPQTIQEWIAEQNNIDTSSPTDTDYSDGIVTYDGQSYQISPSLGNTEATYPYIAYSNMGAGIRWDTGAPVYRSGTTVLVKVGPGSVSQNWGGTYTVYSRHSLVSTYPASAFDPEDYPQIFGPDFYPSQILDALIARDLDSFDIEMTKVNDNLYDHIPVEVDSGQPTSDPNFWELLSKGLKYLAPIAALGDSVIARFNMTDGTVTIETDKGDVELSKEESDSLLKNGVPEGAKIIRVDPKTGTVTYIDPATGQTKTAQVPKTTASNITNNHNVYNTVNNSTKTTNIHQEISLPEVHVSGEIKVSNGTLEPVSQDRVEAARTRFQTSWNNLKQTFADMFTVNLTGIGRLPVWNWPMLGHVIVIDFNVYAEELNWLGLAFLFFATISAIFIVINH